MSIASDIRTQSKQVLDQAQAQLNDVTGQANELYGKTRENVSELASKATSVVSDLRISAEKAVNLDAIKTAVEPYVAQVKEYSTSVTDRAESLFSGVRNDKRVVRIVDVAGSVTGVVVETVQERVVKPVQSLTGRGPKPVKKPATATKPAPTAAAKPATKPAATKPASRPAAKQTARKAPARRTTKA
jgi:nitrate/nitrite-specific signal transduction histidine kinase